jgi:hypothetical protein
MFRLYRVKAVLITFYGALVEDEHYVRARSVDDAILEGVRVFTQAGEELCEVEASLA